MIEFCETDIDLQLAIRAHEGTSFIPEKRGATYVAEYMHHMQAMIDSYAPFATDENREQLAADLARYKAKYLKLLTAYLHSHSAVMSTMITGPANFPTARNRKRSDWADNHRNRWLDYRGKAIARLSQRYDPKEIARAARVVRSDDPQAIEKLQDKLAKMEAQHDMMKDTNKVLRGKGSDADKRLDLIALGWREGNLEKLFVPAWNGRVGFEPFHLSNSSAEMRRTRARIAELEREAEREPVTNDNYLPDVRLEENQDDMRLRLFFDGKPPAAARDILKSNGFKWAPSAGAWQRLLNNNARYAAKTIRPKLATILELETAQ